MGNIIAKSLIAGCLIFMGTGLSVVASLPAQDDIDPWSVELVQDQDDFVIQVTGIAPAAIDEAANADVLDSIIRVYIVKDNEVSRVALFGQVDVKDGAIRFRPRFSLTAGMTYRCMVRFEGRSAVKDFTIPMSLGVASTRVDGVYPSSDVVPENLLKLYVQFNAPMSRGRVYDHVRIRDAEGSVVELTFLEIEEELWDATNTRLTLLFDPGRVKRELRPRQEIGSPLREGNRYTLEVDSDWLDAEGNPLVVSHKKEFGVGVHDETCPDPKGWKVSSPAAGSTEPLILQFDESLDRAMLEHSIVPQDHAGNPLGGEIQISEQETRFMFTPADPWSAGEYSVRISTRLEDRAGNSIRKPFEVDLTKPFASPYPGDFTSLGFVVE